MSKLIRFLGYNILLCGVIASELTSTRTCIVVMSILQMDYKALDKWKYYRHYISYNMHSIILSVLFWLYYHDNVTKWKCFPRHWPFVRVIHRSPVNSPHKGQWRGALMFSLICARINAWVNNREAGDLRRHRAHYDVIVMQPLLDISKLSIGKSVANKPQQNTTKHEPLQLRHNTGDGISNHRHLDCLLNRLFKHRSNKTPTSATLALVRGIHQWSVNSLHEGPVTRRVFPFDYVIMHQSQYHIPEYIRFQTRPAYEKHAHNYS